MFGSSKNRLGSTSFTASLPKTLFVLIVIEKINKK
jgi:hypothetical protein